MLTEKRSVRLLPTILGHFDSRPYPVPGFEWLSLLGVDQDGTVHLLHLLFSIPVGLYSSDWRLFA